MANELIRYEIVMDTASGELSLRKFTAEVEKAGAAGKTASTGFSAMGSSILQVAAGVGLATTATAAFIKTFQYFKDASFAAGEFTKQMSGLGLVLQSIGAPVQQTKGDFLALAIAVEKATGSTRQEGIAALQRFIGLTNDATKAQTAYKLAVNISEGSGKSLAESIDLVANLLSGKAAKSAGEFGIAIKDQNGEMKSASELLVTLQTRYGNATDTIHDGNADVDAATAAWNELKLALGDLTKEAAPVAGFFAKLLQNLTVVTAKATQYGTVLKANFKASSEIWALTKSDKTPEEVQARIAEIQTTLNQTSADADAKFFSVWNEQFGDKLPKSLEATKDAVKDLATVVPVDPKVAAAAKAAADEFDKMTGSTKALTEESKKLQAAYDLTVERFNKGKLSLEQTEYILGKIVERQVQISHQTGGLIGGYGPDTSKQEEQIDKLVEKTREARKEFKDSLVDFLNSAIPLGGVELVAASAYNAQSSQFFTALKAAQEKLSAASQAQNDAVGVDAQIQAAENYNDALDEVTSTIKTNTQLLNIQKNVVLDITSLIASQAFATAAEKIRELTSGGTADDSVFDPSAIADYARAALEEAVAQQQVYLGIQLANELNNAELIGAETTGIKEKYRILQTENERLASQDRIAITRAEKTAKENIAFAYLGAVANLSDQIFKNNKAGAIANAIVNTYEGVTKALGAAPPPYNFILAALVAAAGAVQIRNIANTHRNSTSLNSSIGTSTPPSSSPEPSAATPSIRPLEVTVVLQGAGFISDMDAFGRDFIKAVNRSQLEGSSAPLAGA